MLEMGMTFSFGQLVIDDEIAAMVKRIVRGVGFDDELMGVDLIKEIGIGGHFLAQRHVMDHLATEQIQATLIDRRVREDWLADGAKSMRQVANQKAKEILENHKPEPLPDEMVAELKRIVKNAENS
jgi:trimethylamine--corrinoid protein Co-methyltransferase